MKNQTVLKKFLLLALTGMLLQSCATILGGKINTLVFSEESLPKAEIFVDGEFIGNAPGKIKVPQEKIQHGSVLAINAEGYEKKEYLILRKQNAVYSVVDLILGGIPLAVDYTTGNLYRPVPRRFEYVLIKQK